MQNASPPVGLAMNFDLPNGFADHVAKELAPEKKPLDVLLRCSENLALAEMARRKREQEEQERRLAENMLSQEKLIKAKQERVRELVQILAAAFMAGDLGNDQKMDFNEFQQCIPERVRVRHKEEEMREVFDMADADGSGSLSREEYFFWTLRWMATSGVASGLEFNFRRFDASGDGELSRREWALAADRFGFGELGQDVFTELDHDMTGTISYLEIIETLSKCPHEISHNCQRLLTAMAFYTGDSEDKAGPDGQRGAHNFDNTIWHAQTVDVVRSTIRDRMLEQLATPSDLWQSLLHAAASVRRLSKEDFVKAMYTVLGFECTTTWEHDVSETVYDEMDDDKSNDVTFDEFLNWINCRRQRRRRARQLTLKWRPKRAKPLRRIIWTPDVLRYELQSMLTRAEVSTLDLLMAHDTSENGKLSEEEFLLMIKAIVADTLCWIENGARRVAIDLFKSIAGDDNEVDLEELEGWFIQGMAVEKPRAQKKKEQEAREAAFYKKLQPSKSLPSLGMKARAKSRQAGSANLPEEALTEERSTEGTISGNGLAARWLLRNASIDDVLYVRRADRLRFVPGAKQSVAKQHLPPRKLQPMPGITRMPGLQDSPSVLSLSSNSDPGVQHPTVFNPKHPVYTSDKPALRATKPSAAHSSVTKLIREYSSKAKSSPYEDAATLRFY